LEIQKLPGKKSGSLFEKFMWLISLARNAIVVILGILLAYALFSYKIESFQITGNITEGLPPFSLPPFNIVNATHTYTFTELIGELGSSVLSIPLIAILESIAIAKAFGEQTLERAGESRAGSDLNLKQTNLQLKGRPSMPIRRCWRLGFATYSAVS
jgi:MFS superfamily sulfate permease-like transporter